MKLGNVGWQKQRIGILPRLFDLLHSPVGYHPVRRLLNTEGWTNYSDINNWKKNFENEGGKGEEKNKLAKKVTFQKDKTVGIKKNGGNILTMIPDTLKDMLPFEKKSRKYWIRNITDRNTRWL